MGKVTAVARLSFGCKRVVVPVYAVAGVVMAIDQMVPSGATGRLGLGTLVAGGILHILGRIKRNKAELMDKIDQSVGKVWDAGGRAERRRIELESDSRPLAAVHDLAPRR